MAGVLFGATVAAAAETADFQADAANQRHMRRVEFAGTRFKVTFNGKLLFEVEDRSFPIPA